MPEPNSTTVGIAAGASAGALTGTLIGAQVDALLVGLLAAIFVSIWLPSVDSKLKAGCSVAFSSMLAGYASPVAASYLVAQHASIGNGSPLRLLLALLIGAGSPALFPLLIEWARNRAREKVGEKS
nr:hypothetical protein [Dechloromonas sp.]